MFLSSADGEHRRDVAVRHLQIDAADLLVGDAVDEDAGLLGDLLEGLLDDPGRDRKERKRVEQARGGLVDVFADCLEQGVRRRVRRESNLGVDVLQAETGQLGRVGVLERAFLVEVVVERGERQVHGLLPVHDEGVVGLDVQAAPAQVGGPEDNVLRLRAVDDNHLIVLEALHVLPLDVGRAGRLLEARADWVSPESASPCSLLSSMMIRSFFFSFAKRPTTSGSLRS